MIMNVHILLLRQVPTWLGHLRGDLPLSCGFTVISLLKLSSNILHIFSSSQCYFLLITSYQQKPLSLFFFLEIQGQDNMSLSHLLPISLQNCSTFSCFYSFVLASKKQVTPSPPTPLRLITYTLDSLVLFFFSDIAQSILFFSPGTYLLYYWLLNPISKVCLDFLFTKKKQSSSILLPALHPQSLSLF